MIPYNKDRNTWNDSTGKEIKCGDYVHWINSNERSDIGMFCGQSDGKYCVIPHAFVGSTIKFSKEVEQCYKYDLSPAPIS